MNQSGGRGVCLFLDEPLHIHYCLPKRMNLLLYCRKVTGILLTVIGISEILINANKCGSRMLFFYIELITLGASTTFVFQKCIGVFSKNNRKKSKAWIFQMLISE